MKILNIVLFILTSLMAVCSTLLFLAVSLGAGLSGHDSSTTSEQHLASISLITQLAGTLPLVSIGALMYAISRAKEKKSPHVSLLIGLLYPPAAALLALGFLMVRDILR